MRLRQGQPNFDKSNLVGQSTWSIGLLYLGRAIWHLAIVGLYGVASDNLLFRAVMAVGAAMYTAVTLLLSSQIDHARWPLLRLRLLRVELGVSFGLGLLMLLSDPTGPASLLLLPTLLTFAWLDRDARSRYEIWSILLTLALYICSIEFALAKGIYRSAWFHTLSAPISAFYLLFSLYVVVIVFASVLAWLIRRQLQERRRFQTAVGQLEYQSEQLSRVNDEVNRYANRVYDLAAVEERNRIAGQIHDTVAHRLTALLVQLQGARRMMGQHDAESAAENVRVSEALAREALEEVRKSVRAVGGQHAGKEGVSALRKLSLHYASVTGMDIRFAADSEVEQLPPEFMGMLYRVVQEGLTNAQRHGRATQVEITLKRVGLNLQLDIQDNGRGAAQPSLGFGLSSMRSRFQRLGGDIQVFSEPGKGFALKLNLPMWEVS